MQPQEAPYIVPATDKTPRVELFPDKGLLSIIGCSIPENADRLYLPLYDRLKIYAAEPPAGTLVRVELAYFNSSSSKYLLDLFKLLEDLHAMGRSKVVVEWHHEHDDLDMEEAGRDFKALLEIPVRLVSI